MKSIRTKILLSMTLTVILSLLVTGITSIVLNYHSTNALLEQTMTEAAKIAAQRVEHELEAYANVAYDTGCMSLLADPNVALADKQTIIDQRIASHNFIYGNILDKNCVSIFTGTDYSDRLYAQEALKGNIYISEPLVSKVDGKLAVMVAAPLWENGTPNTNVVGVIYFKPEETFLNDIVTSIQISDNGSAYILNAEGTTIAHENIDNVKNQENTISDAQTDASLATLATLETKMTAGESGFGGYRYGGAAKFLAYAPIAGTDGWSFAVSAPTSDFMGATIQSIIISVILLAVAAILSVLLAVRLAIGISKPIGQCCDRLELLAQGDLNSPVPQIKNRDETGRLASSTNTIAASFKGIIEDISWGMGELASGNFTVSSQKTELYQRDFARILSAMKDLIDRMTDTLSQVHAAADQVSAGSDQVSAGAQALSQGATEQASSVEELAASVTEISGGVKTTAGDAVRARDETNLSGQKMEIAIAEMQELTTSIEKISRTSGEIGKVIKTIEDIAFQTNILALNAAVEAARAGEAGKGFAVVADEVRNLATKSADASKETAELIDSSVKAVEHGSHIADKTAKSLGEVGESAQRVTVMIDAIAKAAQEQSGGLAQITVGIDQISSVVQTNSATAEESAAASEELSGQAQMLKDLVEKFQLLQTSEGSYSSAEERVQQQMETAAPLPLELEKY